MRLNRRVCALALPQGGGGQTSSVTRRCRRVRTRLASPNAKWAKSDVANDAAQGAATPQSAFCQLERIASSSFRFAPDASPRSSSDFQFTSN